MQQQQQQRSFIPPFVRDLVYFDTTQYQPFSSSDDPNTHHVSKIPIEYISGEGLIILEAMQYSLPSAVAQSHIPTASQPQDFDPFRRSCVSVLSKLTRLTLQEIQGRGDNGAEATRALLELYDVDGLEPWLGATGKQATKVWFEAFVRGEYDQAWLIGSTVLEQLIVNVSVYSTCYYCQCCVNERYEYLALTYTCAIIVP